MKQIWVLCGGPSTEYEVSLSSGRCVCRAIDATNRIVRPVIVTRNGGWLISEKTLEGGGDRTGFEESVNASGDREWLDGFFDSAKAEWDQPGVTLPVALARMVDEAVDCVFLAFHGQYGEDGSIQGFLQTAGIPYTGSGVLASAVAFNKAVSLATFARVGLPVAKSVLVTRQEPFPDALKDLNYPVFTKPVCGGSSLGVSLVKSARELEAGISHALEHDSQGLVEEKIEGVEVSCGVLDFVEDGRTVARAMPPTLISPTESEFFDYEAKYVPGKSNDVTPAPLPAALVERIQQLAVEAHKALGCEGMSRTDMIVRPEEDAVPVMLETQTLPGMTPTSLIPQQCAAVGISFAKFIDLLIEHALFKASQK